MPKSAPIRRVFRASWPPVLVLVLIVLLAEVIVRATEVPAYLVPAPSAVLSALFESRREIWGSLLTTASAALLGFGLATVLGVGIAMVLSVSRFVQRAIYPYMIFFQTVPVVAIAPVLVIWFGPGLHSVTICALIVAIFPVIANTLAGLLSTDIALREMFRLYGAGWWPTLWKLKLPSAMPNIVTGMRIASGLAVIGAIVGEFVAGVLQGNAGLGVEVMIAKRIGRTDLVFAAVLAASFLGLAMFGTINLAGHLVLRRWHASERAPERV